MLTRKPNWWCCLIQHIVLTDTVGNTTVQQKYLTKNTLTRQLITARSFHLCYVLDIQDYIPLKSEVHFPNVAFEKVEVSCNIQGTS